MIKLTTQEATRMAENLANAVDYIVAARDYIHEEMPELLTYDALMCLRETNNVLKEAVKKAAEECK